MCCVLCIRNCNVQDLLCSRMLVYKVVGSDLGVVFVGSRSNSIKFWRDLTQGHFDELEEHFNTVLLWRFRGRFSSFEDHFNRVCYSSFQGRFAALEEHFNRVSLRFVPGSFWRVRGALNKVHYRFAVQRSIAVQIPNRTWNGCYARRPMKVLELSIIFSYVTES